MTRPLRRGILDGMGKRGALLAGCIALGGCDAPAPTNAATPVAAAPETLESAPDTYMNEKHGFAITVPRGWTQSAFAANADGARFEQGGFDAELRVEAGADSGVRPGVTIDSQNFRVHTRVLRTRTGSVVVARFRHPALRTEFEPVAEATLASLRAL